MPTLMETTGDVLTRMLRRLPPSLWDQDPLSETLQRDLYAAFAYQMAIWLENQHIARTMTLLREAQGVDLDVLLADYGLKRYCQRPDDYARQIAENILFTPKGTQYAVDHLADLLYDQPHMTLRTGRGQTHVFVAATAPISTPYAYWGLVSQDGLWYALTVNGAVPVISQMPPPGIDLSPGVHTLAWCTALDQNGLPWYVTIKDDTLFPTQVQPSGYGTTAPFVILDGESQRWRLTVDSLAEAVVVTLDPGLTTFGYWRLLGPGGTVYALWIEGRVPTFSTTPPGGGGDQTPGGSPLAWVNLPDETGTSWFVVIQDDTLFVQRTQPAGTGTTQDAEFLDATGVRWHLRVDSRAEAVVSVPLPGVTDDYVLLTPQTQYGAVRLVDSSGVSWWLTVSGGIHRLTSTLPTGAADLTPPGGPYRWLRAYDLAGTRWYAAPNTSGTLVVSATNPGGLGTGEPTMLGDANGVLWHYGVTMGGVFAVSSTPPVDYGGLSTTICLNDANGKHWFWRIVNGLLQWSPVLWPDSVDQSPWGEIGWLKTVNDIAETVYVFPGPTGMPRASSAPPATSPWGWEQPVTLVDAQGQRWSLAVTSRPQTLEYWQVRDVEMVVRYLSIDGAVPSVALEPPAGGVDSTPGGVPQDWISLYDEFGSLWYGVIDDDTLTMSRTLPVGTGTLAPFQAWGPLGTFWSLQASLAGDTVVTVALPNPNVVEGALDTAAAIPFPPERLCLRDASDAISHVQAAGSLVTINIS